MQKATGDIWKFHSTGWIVIPTNIGWRRDGSNIMGAGLAKQAAEKFSDFPLTVGEYYRDNGVKSTTRLHEGYQLISFPTKELDPANPWMSWKQNSSLERVEQSAKDLAILMRNYWNKEYQKNDRVYLPYVGCGNGRLKAKDVMPILKEHLADHRFILVGSGFLRKY